MDDDNKISICNAYVFRVVAVYGYIEPASARPVAGSASLQSRKMSEHTLL